MSRGEEGEKSIRKGWKSTLTTRGQALPGEKEKRTIVKTREPIRNSKPSGVGSRKSGEIYGNGEKHEPDRKG